MLFAFAVMHITTGLTSILNATVPLSGALVAWLWLKDRPGGSRMLGLVIGFAGVTLLVLGKSGFSATGVAGAGSTGITLLAMGACLLATLCYGLAASFTKRHLTGAHPLATATGSQIGATLGLAVPMLWFWPTEPVSITAWAAVAAVALLCTVHRLHPVLPHHRTGRPEQGAHRHVPRAGVRAGLRRAVPERNHHAVDGGMWPGDHLRHRVVDRSGAGALARDEPPDRSTDEKNHRGLATAVT